MTDFIVGPVMTVSDLDEIRNKFWVIYADEAKHDREACVVVYEILKVLKTYRDYIVSNGEF